jgi:hypothetical protein
VHRAIRDIQKCRVKYGDAWMEYERRVPWLFIPVSFFFFLSLFRLVFVNVISAKGGLTDVSVVCFLDVYVQPEVRRRAMDREQTIMLCSRFRSLLQKAMVTKAKLI